MRIICVSFRTSEKVFESSEPIYYPDDEVTLRLISYYPYQEEGVNMGRKYDVGGGRNRSKIFLPAISALISGCFSKICNQLLKEPSPCTMITNFSN